MLLTETAIIDSFAANENVLGNYLRDRRTKQDPAAFGLPGGRRRTPGLRREEVALLANISPTWYTSLEQGRGGPPSADVLERISRALKLSDVEREHLFLLGLGRPPQLRYRRNDDVPARLQSVLDALDPNPAVIRTAMWDILGWNRAATIMMTDFAAIPPDQRNVLRFIFGNPAVRAAQVDWESTARFVIGAFRVDAARAGAQADMEPLVAELSALCPDFQRIWRESDVQGTIESEKQMSHPLLGAVSFHYSVFAVEGRPDLSMAVYIPTAQAVRDKIISFIQPLMAAAE